LALAGDAIHALSTLAGVASAARDEATHVGVVPHLGVL